MLSKARRPEEYDRRTFVWLELVSCVMAEVGAQGRGGIAGWGIGGDNAI